MCAHFMYADFMIFFTYGCLVRDDLIKKFKQTYLIWWYDSNGGDATTSKRFQHYWMFVRRIQWSPVYNMEMHHEF